MAEETSARTERRGRKEALDLARSVITVIAARGSSLVTFDMKADPPDDATLLAHLLGPTGNLRAPTLRRGQVLLVGFSEAAFRKVLAG